MDTLPLPLSLSLSLSLSVCLSPSFHLSSLQVLAYSEGLHGKWMFSEIRAVFSRRYLLQNTAMEVFMANRSKKRKRTCTIANKKQQLFNTSTSNHAMYSTADKTTT